MKTPKGRFLARAGRSAPDRRGGHVFRTPKVARGRAVRSARRAVRRSERTLRWQRADAAEEARP